MPYRVQPLPIEALESRRLLAAAAPSNLEQYVVELINRGRANPAAEAARYGVDLNEGLAAGTISTARKQPLAISPYLEDSSRKHSQWMIDTDTFSHTGAGGSNPKDRMTAAGYPFRGTWSWGENIAWNTYTGSSLSTSLANQIEKGLFVDTWVADRGHRIDLMNPSFREVGAGFVSGAFEKYNPVGMLTQDFASESGKAFLTGVAYRDTVAKDRFYTPGEGLGGVTVTARRAADGAVFSTTTFASGGYSLQLAPGSYAVSASGGPLAEGVDFGTVTIGSENVKADFVPGVTRPLDTTPPTATLTQALRKRSASRYYAFTVTYADETALDPATFDDYDIQVEGPGGYVRYANFDSGNSTAPGTTRVVNYVVKGPGGAWDAADNGVYTITLRRRQVRDTAGNPAGATVLGAFSARIPVTASTSVTRGLVTPVPAGVFAPVAAIRRRANEESVLA
jgi:uncharacterized protein YkwD